MTKSWEFFFLDSFQQSFQLCVDKWWGKIYSKENDMQVTYSVNKNLCLVNLHGELDECSAPAVRNNLDKILATLEPMSEVVLDFKNVGFMDSTGIGVVVGRYKKYRPNFISFVIKNPNRTVDRILKMTGIYTLIPKIEEA